MATLIERQDVTTSDGSTPEGGVFITVKLGGILAPIFDVNGNAQANPFQSGSDGSFAYYVVASGTYTEEYRFNLTDSPRTIIAVDVGTTGSSSSGAMTNVLDYGAKGDNSADDTAAVQAAINAVALTGGTLYFPPGIYKHTGLTLKNHCRYLGAGIDIAASLGTVLLYTGTGDGVVIANPVNSSTNANIAIEGIHFRSATRTAGKGALADTGSGQLRIRHCTFSGADRLLVLDQSELTDITECDFEVPSSGTCGVWLVNGNDRGAGAASGYTNRISISRCQLDLSLGAYGIIDDGGNAHVFADNNYNGGLTHIRAVGVAVLRIDGGEFESASSTNIVFSNTTFDAARSEGGCTAVHINGCEISNGSHGAINFASSCSPVLMTGNFFASSSGTKVSGMVNVYELHASGNAGNGGAIFDGFAQHHHEVGNTGAGTLGINSNIGQLLNASISPEFNSEMVVELTSNTSLTFKVKGSDGTVRTASLTLA